jgi:DNA-binding XRE family transcriptional regulator
MISNQKYLEEQLKGEAFRQAYEDELLLAQAAIQTACPLGIAQRRQQQGLTQEELGRKAHLKPEQVSYLEEGNNRVHLLTFLKASRVLNFSFV